MSIFFLPAALIIGLLLSVAVLHLRKQPISGIRNPHSSILKPTRQLIATTTPPKARPGIDYAAERQMIRLALAGGMAPGAVAGLLRGSPQARRQRVLKVAREQQRVAPQQKLEAATA
jgi:hypothetical protein